MCFQTLCWDKFEKNMQKIGVYISNFLISKCMKIMGKNRLEMNKFCKRFDTLCLDKFKRNTCKNAQSFSKRMQIAFISRQFFARVFHACTKVKIVHKKYAFSTFFFLWYRHKVSQNGCNMVSFQESFCTYFPRIWQRENYS